MKKKSYSQENTSKSPYISVDSSSRRENYSAILLMRSQVKEKQRQRPKQLTCPVKVAKTLCLEHCGEGGQ